MKEKYFYLDQTDNAIRIVERAFSEAVIAPAENPPTRGMKGGAQLKITMPSGTLFFFQPLWIIEHESRALSWIAGL